ncbi:hypothetical protein AWB81_07798 [Caballeronia arationis]|jgi:hypothetical protein|uniref:Uncharacterized protein n=1 Tax=Caballeronia arationis TaxID=1777142 RepID=A0A7Z7I5C9_9BURK|nr:hypothetical protein AWB81_07798 [Caballeronia arationis]SOE64359.1 hypothetical protein SAMN05446927_2720 [Caballeronia arationis]
MMGKVAPKSVGGRDILTEQGPASDMLAHLGD